MIYDKDGNILNVAYDKDNTSLRTCYDKDGNPIVLGGTVIKVMSYNVGGWYTGSGGNVPPEDKESYYALQTGMIQDNDPDILIIQEYMANFSSDGTSALTMLQSLFPYVQTVTSGTWFGRAVCSKYQITDYVRNTYTQESSRYFDSCTVTIENTPVTVITTHLGLTQENRTPEIAQLLEYLGTLDTFIVGGDFNTEITPSTASKTSTKYINNVKPFADAGYHMANFAREFLVTYYDDNGNTNPLYLDNIITSSDLAVAQSYVDTTKLTDGIVAKIDHIPLIAELVIN